MAEWLGPGVIRVDGKLVKPGETVTKDMLGEKRYKALDDKGMIGAKAGRPPKSEDK